MAETQDDIDATEDSGGKSKKLIIIIAALVLVLGGGGAMMFLGGGDEEATEGSAAEVTPVKQTAIYFAVKDAFIVNFSKQSNDTARYLQLKLKVMARDQAVIDAVQLHMPAIQDELLLLLYGQDYDDLNKSTKALKAATLTLINEILKAEGVENELKAVYFTSFLMQ